MDPLEACLNAGDWDGLAARCEQAELMAASSGKTTSPEICSALLAVYLLKRDLVSAKFLWKRMPASYQGMKDMSQLWEIGQALWKKDFRSVHVKLRVRPNWPQHVQPIMKALLDSVRREVVTLVSHSYSRISASMLAGMLGVDDATAACNELGWTLENDFVQPRKVCSEAVSLWMENKKRLLTLTNYISALEN
ncbi:COP9 signalosome complex subunit 8-like [Sycon ciliatum]|uniref:COP9 signalosome complex subunit 8-like n=1 Tax=Sycon ciliatum TaxID=27933 RepID=UPI0031F7207E